MNTERLRKVEAHLRSGKLGHRVFDFARFNAGFSEIYDEKGCGSHGCALGELPFIFPEEWAFSKTGLRDPYWFNNMAVFRKSSLDQAALFFDLTFAEICQLFVPFEPSTEERFGIYPLPYKASPKEVADNIDLFIKYKEKPGNE